MFLQSKRYINHLKPIQSLDQLKRTKSNKKIRHNNLYLFILTTEITSSYWKKHQVNFSQVTSIVPWTFGSITQALLQA